MAIDWEERWRARIADPAYCRWDRCGMGLSPFLELVDRFRRESWRRVIVVGCGISAEPALIAHLGYEVVAVDVSRVAIDHITSVPATRDEMARWLGDRPESCDVGERSEYTTEQIFRLDKALALLDSLHRSGGSLEHHCASFETFTHGASFDVVYCPRVWQCLDDGPRAELPRRAFGWLAPGGACRLATHNLSDGCPEGSLHDGRLNELLDGFRGAGFFHRDEVDDDARAHALLDGGARMFDLFNGSG